MSSMQRSKMLCLQSDVPPLCSPSCVSCLPQGFALVHSRGARTCWSPGKVFESTGAVEDTECTANSTGECCLLKVVQPLVWRLLGLHKIQMQVEVNKRKVCHVMISTLGGYGWSQLDGWIDQSYIQYHAWSLRWLIHHIVKYFHTHIRFLELFGLFGGVRLSWCRPFLECIHSSHFLPLYSIEYVHPTIAIYEFGPKTRLRL